MYKNQLSRQTGSRNLTGPKTLPTIWYTYMTLVTKYQISAINSYCEKCDEKYLGQTEGPMQNLQMNYVHALQIVQHTINSENAVNKCWRKSKGNQERKIQRNWQHWTHDTERRKQNKKHNTEN